MPTRAPIVFVDLSGNEILLPPADPAPKPQHVPAAREKTGLDRFFDWVVMGFGLGSVAGFVLFLLARGYDFAAIRGFVIYLWTR